MTRTLSTRIDPVFGCDLVLGPLDRDGYGTVGRQRTHIVAWVEANGPVPESMELDHTCRRRNCRALHHLELVTRSENEKRKSWKYRAKQTHCPHGHTMADALVTPEGGRLCRSCEKEARHSTAAPSSGDGMPRSTGYWCVRS